MSKEFLTDEAALIHLNELAKSDNEALKLMALLQDTRDFGSMDMMLSKIHRYIEDKQRG